MITYAVLQGGADLLVFFTPIVCAYVPLLRKTCLTSYLEFTFASIQGDAAFKLVSYRQCTASWCGHWSAVQDSSDAKVGSVLNWINCTINYID